MKKIATALGIAIVLSVSTYLLMINSHIDIYGANAEKIKAFSEYSNCDNYRNSTPRTMISLMYLENYDPCFKYSLNTSGWLTVIGVVGISPLLLGLFLSNLIFKKKTN